MKKFLLVFLFVATFFTSFSQPKSDTTKHLTFKGIPIDGTLDDYVSKMKHNGFTYTQTQDGTAILNGDFAGYKDCTVGVSTLKEKDLVYAIVVIFSQKNTWSTLSGNYFDLKQMLTEKYGNPSEIVEQFDGYSQPRDDEGRMYKVKFDNCKYSSIWQTDKGEIKLSIGHSGVTTCFVNLAYFDKINSNKMRAKAKDDL